MKLSAVLCVPLGHKWAPLAESDSPEPVMQCRRCGRTGTFSETTRSTKNLEQRIKGTDGFGNKLP
jgi:hypothetical protein